MNEEIKVGDEVVIVTYGHITMVYNDEGGLEPLDAMPQLVNKCGIVDRIVGKKYYIRGINPKYGPYDKDQLEIKNKKL